jgi:hypothetical protein
MTPQRILGVVLLIIGVAVLIIGMNSSHSLPDQVSNTFTGRFTGTTMWYILGGIAAGLVGLLMVVFGVRGKDA